MRWIWIFLWIALSTIQLVSFGMKRLMEQASNTRTLDVDDRLIELARQTNREWNLAGELLSSPDHSNPNAEKGDGPIKREEWILRLSDLQQQLFENGIEVRLLDDLERWLSVQAKSNHAGSKENVINAYLASVLHWFDPFLTGRHISHLERIRLEPGSLSSFPDLHFELSGMPEEMGQLLLNSSSEHGDWEMNELDLYCHGDMDTWWLQGNCAFRPTGKG